MIMSNQEAMLKSRRLKRNLQIFHQQWIIISYLLIKIDNIHLSTIIWKIFLREGVDINYGKAS